MEEYNLRREQQETEELIYDLKSSASRMDDFESAKYNVDNCSCPSCPCCDPEMSWLRPVGAGVLAASSSIMVLAVAK